MKNTILIKAGGDVLASYRKRMALLETISQLAKKYHIVFVHGGKSQINSDMKTLNKKAKFINGQRYTDEETLKTVESSLSHLNHQIVCELNNLNVKAVGICGIDGKMFEIQRIKKLGLVGRIKSVNPDLILSLLKENYLPVISPISAGKRILNVNADYVAGTLASALKCKKLIFISDVPGILDEKGKTIKEIRMKDFDKLKKQNIIKTGMIPKVSNCYSALKEGVKEIYITNKVDFISKGKLNLCGTKITLS